MKYFKEIMLKNTEKLNGRVGVSITERRGKWRVKLGKKITSGKPSDKLFATEQEACTYVEGWVKDRVDRGQAAKNLSDAELTDADNAFKLLKDWKDDHPDSDFDQSLTELVKLHLKSLPESKAVCIKELIELYLHDRDTYGEAAARHLQQLQYSFKPLVSFFGEQGVHEITKKDLLNALNALHGKKAAKTYNNHRLNWSALMSFAKEEGHVKQNVLAGTKKKKTVKREVEVYTPTEIKTILDGASECSSKDGNKYLLLFLALQAFAGIRAAEVVRLKWSDITDKEIVLKAETTKTSQRRTVPILPPLQAILNAYFVGMHPDAKIIGVTGRSLEKPRARLVKKLGITWKHNGLRHSFVTYRLESLQDVKKVALEAGHTAEITQKHYRSIITDGEAVAQEYWNTYVSDIINIKEA